MKSNSNKKGIISLICGISTLVINIIASMIITSHKNNTILNPNNSMSPTELENLLNQSVMSSTIVAIICTIIAVIGLVIGIISKRQRKKAGQKCGLAIAGIIVNILFIIWGLLNIISGLLM